MILQNLQQGGDTSNDTLSDSEPDKEGTLILDATCAPVNIRYPQDVSLLNEAREKLETIIYRFHKSYGLELPRRYAKEHVRIILHLPSAESIQQEKFEKHCVSSCYMSNGI